MISQPVLDKINKAEDDLAAAQTADQAHAATVIALTQTQGNEQNAGKAAMAAHQIATQSAMDAIVALKDELQLPAS